MREIPLTQGKMAMVDDADYLELMRYRWHFRPGRRTDYAERQGHKGEPGAIHMHRQIMGFPVGGFCHHINHNGLDNQRHNLAILTCAENLADRGTSRIHETKKKGRIADRTTTKAERKVRVRTTPAAREKTQRTMIGLTLVARDRLAAMATEDRISMSAFLQRFIDEEWERRQAEAARPVHISEAKMLAASELYLRISEISPAMLTRNRIADSYQEGFWIIAALVGSGLVAEADVRDCIDQVSGISIGGAKKEQRREQG